MSANLPDSETGMAINNSSQGSVATHVRGGGIFKLLNYCKLQLIVPWKNFVNRSTFDQVLDKKVDCITALVQLCTIFKRVEF